MLLNYISKSKFIFLSVIFIFLFLSFSAVNAGDEKCPGTCMYTTDPCVNGKFISGLCSGPANRQCCVPKDYESDTGSRFGGKTEDSQTKITLPNPLGVGTFAELIARIQKWLLYIGAPILTLMIIIGAFQILTAGGVPEKITKGRHTITYAIIGYALLLLSTGIMTIIENVLGVK
jgi:hypothetical protein